MACHEIFIDVVPSLGMGMDNNNILQWRSNESQLGVAEHRHNRFTQTKMSECSYLLADQGYIGLETIGEDDCLL